MAGFGTVHSIGRRLLKITFLPSFLLKNVLFDDFADANGGELFENFHIFFSQFRIHKSWVLQVGSEFGIEINDQVDNDGEFGLEGILSRKNVYLDREVIWVIKNGVFFVICF